LEPGGRYSLDRLAATTHTTVIGDLISNCYITFRSAQDAIGHELPGQVLKVGAADRRYPPPAAVAQRLGGRPQVARTDVSPFEGTVALDAARPRHRRLGRASMTAAYVPRAIYMRVIAAARGRCGCCLTQAAVSPTSWCRTTFSRLRSLDDHPTVHVDEGEVRRDVADHEIASGLIECAHR